MVLSNRCPQELSLLICNQQARLCTDGHHTAQVCRKHCKKSIVNTYDIKKQIQCPNIPSLFKSGKYPQQEREARFTSTNQEVPPTREGGQIHLNQPGSTPNKRGRPDSPQPTRKYPQQEREARFTSTNQEVPPTREGGQIHLNQPGSTPNKRGRPDSPQPTRKYPQQEREARFTSTNQEVSPTREGGQIHLNQPGSTPNKRGRPDSPQPTTSPQPTRKYPQQEREARFTSTNQEVPPTREGGQPREGGQIHLNQPGSIPNKRGRPDSPQPTRKYPQQEREARFTSTNQEVPPTREGGQIHLNQPGSTPNKRGRPDSPQPSRTQINPDHPL